MSTWILDSIMLLLSGMFNLGCVRVILWRVLCDSPFQAGYLASEFASLY